MRFKHFFRLFEYGEIENADVSDIALRQSRGYDGRTHYDFWFGQGQDQFTLSFVQTRISVNGTPLTQKAYDVMFEGPNGLDQTNDNRPHSVYTQMLRGFKKFIEQVHPEGFHFYGASGSMDLTYDAMFRRFLAERPGGTPETTFVRIDTENYVRKDIYDALPQEIRDYVDQKMQVWQQHSGDYFQRRRQQRQIIRHQNLIRQRNQPSPNEPQPPTDPIESTKFDGFLFREIREIEDMDVSNIQLQPESRYGESYHKYEFNVEGARYVVTMKQYPIHDARGTTITSNGCEIIFTGPNGTSLTNRGQSHAIYTQMLAGIKRYMEEFKPEGLHFYGADSSMDLTYLAFVDMFLSDKPHRTPDKVFLRIGEQDYVRKDVYENLDPIKKQSVDQSINAWKVKEAEYVEERRKRKIARRQLMRDKAKFMGGLYKFDDDNYAFIIDATSDRMYYISMPSYTDEVYSDSTYWDYTQPDRIITKDKILQELGADRLKRMFEKLFDYENRYVLEKVPHPLQQEYRAMYDRIINPPPEPQPEPEPEPQPEPVRPTASLRDRIAALRAQGSRQPVAGAPRPLRGLNQTARPEDLLQPDEPEPSPRRRPATTPTPGWGDDDVW